jgi:hypothetical protein
LPEAAASNLDEAQTLERGFATRGKPAIAGRLAYSPVFTQAEAGGGLQIRAPI